MGWIGYNATHYKRDGSIDRKAELDYDLFRGDTQNTLVKSAIVGSTYYAAVRYKDGNVWGLVVLTQSDMRNRNGCNFYYKDMSEDMGPYCYDCPVSILKLLSPTDHPYALEWRKKCADLAARKKSPSALSRLPIGSVIQFERSGKVERLTKHTPSYQFKRPFWYSQEGGYYIPTNRIPTNYTVVKEAGL